MGKLIRTPVSDIGQAKAIIELLEQLLAEQRKTNALLEQQQAIGVDAPRRYGG